MHVYIKSEKLLLIYRISTLRGGGIRLGKSKYIVKFQYIFTKSTWLKTNMELDERTHWTFLSLLVNRLLLMSVPQSVSHPQLFIPYVISDVINIHHNTSLTRHGTSDWLQTACSPWHVKRTWFGEHSKLTRLLFNNMLSDLDLIQCIRKIQ